MGQEAFESSGEDPRQRFREAAAWYEYRSELRQRYLRVREYVGLSLDQLINERTHQRYLCEVWLLSCMVRKPVKAARMPAGNPFRTQRLREEEKQAQEMGDGST